jgi:hypothetical protein
MPPQPPSTWYPSAHPTENWLSGFNII